MDDFSPAPKPNHKRMKPKRKKRGEFTQEIKQAIINRDDSKCRVCKGHCTDNYGQIHHVRPKGSGFGRGVYENGMLVCPPCHDDIHRDINKLHFWQRTFEMMYGSRYYKDDFDE